VVKIALYGREKLTTAIHEVVISICEIKKIFFIERLKKYILQQLRELVRNFSICKQ
jgi:hypothetical protein